MLRFMGSQRVGHDSATELNRTELSISSCAFWPSVCLFRSSTHFFLLDDVFYIDLHQLSAYFRDKYLHFFLEYFLLFSGLSFCLFMAFFAVLLSLIRFHFVIF